MNTTTTTTMASSLQITTSNPPATTTTPTFTSCKSCKKWGTPCPFLHSTNYTPLPQESPWSDEDWNGDRQRERKKKEQQQKKEEDQRQKQKDIEQVPNDYCPQSPIYHPTLKEVMPIPIDNRQELQPNYYPSNYVPNSMDNTLILVDNVVAPPAKTKEENKGEATKEEDRRQGKGDKTQTEEEDSGEDDDDYLDYLDSDYIYWKNIKERNIRIV